MKKWISLILVISMLLCFCSCEEKYECAECGKDYAFEASKLSTAGLCRECYNLKPYGNKYCACGNSADTSRAGNQNVYLCTECWGNVEKAVQNAIG